VGHHADLDERRLDAEPERLLEQGLGILLVVGTEREMVAWSGQRPAVM
jgi:hypothetical protein